MKIILLLVSIILFTSCQNGKQDKLHKRVIELEEINAKLTDSINNIERDKIISSSLMLLPQEKKVKSQESNNFTGIFFQNVSFPKYNIYEITTDSNGTRQRKLVQRGNTESKFHYEFTPRSKNDNQIELLAEFEKDTIRNERLEILYRTTLTVE